MSKQIHIALVGGQTMPVFLAIRATSPDKIILVHSADSKLQADSVRNEYPDQTELVEFDPVDMEVIDRKVGLLLDRFSDSDCQLTINLTSGTKLWAIAFALRSQGRPNVSLLYVDQNGVFYDCLRACVWPRQPQLDLDMETLMRFNGQSPQRHVLLSDYTASDMQTLNNVNRLRSDFPDIFNSLTLPNKEWNKQFEGGNEGKHSEGRSRIRWKRNPDPFVDFHIERKYGSPVDRLLKSPHCIQIVFNAGFFEYDVAQILSQWSGAREVWLNVIYPYSTGNAKNEIDVVVNTGSKLLMVECKTQIYDVTDIDKFRTAVKNYGGMGCKALFVTDAPMKLAAAEKCRDSSILTFCFDDYKNQKTRVRNEALYHLLDTEMSRLNTK